MPDPPETLLVCFLGNPTAGSASRPSVWVLGADGALQTVCLAAETRRLVALLALTPDPPDDARSSRGRTSQVAELLAGPLPQRRASEISDALGYSRSQTWRLRRRLKAELEDQRLARHVYAERRGWVGLVQATSDVAALYAAVREERWELSTRLLLLVADGGDPQTVSLFPDAGWGSAFSAHIRDAIRQAQEHLDIPAAQLPPAPQLLYPDEEYVEGEVVASDASSDWSVGGATHELILRPYLQANAMPAERPASPWRRRRRSVTPAALATILLLLVTWLATTTSPSRHQPTALELSAQLAGPWPEGETYALANLTRSIGFQSPSYARLGDVLLVGVRLDVEDNTAWRKQPFVIEASTDRASDSRVDLGVSMNGPSVLGAGSVQSQPIGELNPNELVTFVPHSVVLLDQAGRVLAHLPDIQSGARYHLPFLVVGKIYYVEWRLHIVAMPTTADGQIGASEVIECAHSKQSQAPVNPRARVGDTVYCGLQVLNWGPRPLRNVRVRVWAGATRGRQIPLYATVFAARAEPREVQITGELNISTRTRTAKLQYIEGSQRLIGPSGATNDDVIGNAASGWATIASVPPGEAQAVHLELAWNVL